MNLTLVKDSTPELEPVSVDEAKANLRLDTNDDNASIQGMILAARLEAENEHARELSKKQWLLALDRFPTSTWGGKFRCGGRYYFLGNEGQSIVLMDPLVSVDSFTWKAADGTVNTLVENTDYAVDVRKHPGIVYPLGDGWPSCDLWPSSAIEITFTAGHTPDDQPAPTTIKQGILMLVSDWYECRVEFSDTRFGGGIPPRVLSLFRNGKLWKF